LIYQRRRLCYADYYQYRRSKSRKALVGDYLARHSKKSYFESKFVSTDDESIIQRKTELESDNGDAITFDLCVQLRNEPTYGDNRLDGKQEQLRFFTDQVLIDQVRHAVSAGGKMTRKRTLTDLRTTAKSRLSDYFSKLYDEYWFIYLSGARGINQDFTVSTAFTGFAGNALNAPDAAHLIYGGSATSKATVTTSDKMTKSTVERAGVKAKMMRALDPTQANMVPVSGIEGSEKRYVLLMSEFSAYDLRQSDTQGWVDVQKALATAVGKESPIFKGGLGMINDTILHSHASTIRFNDYGAGANLPACRNLFLGRQAGVVGFGTTGGMKMDWQEELKDFKNEPVVASGFIAGMKKSRFNNSDFGVISIDTYASNPN